MIDNDRDMTPRNFNIRTDQEAMLIQLAKESDRSVSGALRFILDDWLSFKRLAIADARIPDQVVPA